MSGPGIPDDFWLLRTDALVLVKVALNCTEDEAADCLTEFACACSPLEWRCAPPEIWLGKYRPRLPALTAAGPQAPKRSPLSVRPVHEVLEDVKVAIGIEFWRKVRRGEACVAGNAATYSGPLFLAFDAERVLASGREFYPTGKMIRGFPDLQVEIHLIVIQFLAASLISWLQRKGVVLDAAVEHLQALGRLPRPAESDRAVSEKVWLGNELNNHPPGGLTKSKWAKNAAARSNGRRQANSIQSLLSKHHEMWIDAHGKATPSSLKRRRGSNHR
jgi:hypothetical protein